MQRVVDSHQKAHVTADRRKTEVNEPTATRAASSVTEECRRLAELLRLDVVGVVSMAGDARKVAVWTDPGALPTPERLDDVLAGRVAGWIVCPMPGGDSAVFARTTDASAERAADVLRAVGPSLTAEVAESGTPSRPGLSSVSSPAAPPGIEAPARSLQEALTTIRDEAGFDTASLFEWNDGAWRLVARSGPAREWHVVLDPRVAGSAPGDVLFPDARAIPGTGERLAAMGCAAVGVLALPHGARLVLDAAERRTADRGWGALSRVHREQLAAALGADVGSGLAGTGTELDAIERVGETIRSTLEDPSSDVPALLAGVANAIEAVELCHVVDRGGNVDIASHPPRQWSRQFPQEVRSALRTLAAPEPSEEATARQLGVVLGFSSSHVVAAAVADGPALEALVAGWGGGAGLPARAMRTVLRLTGAARAVIEARRTAVDSMMARERNRWASEIHDGLTQVVTTAVLELEAMQQRIRQDPQGAVETLGATKAEIRKSLSELREVLFDLSREGGSGGSSSLEPLAKYVDDVVQRWRLPARVSVEGDLPDVPRPVLATAYVVIRESLANAAKHASPASVSVKVRTTSDEVIVEVGDTGRGFVAFDAPSGARARGHFGLDMMKRRVAEVGGTLDVQSTPGQGTRVVARLPVRGGES
jgi:signal transduction histidine kinase